jgi:SsrA-binding protein
MTKPIAENRRARYDYFIEETIEAGLMLTGTEVKSLRVGRANIAESYASVEGRTIKLINADIPPYGHANRFNHEPRRHRTLLLHRKQIDKLIGAVQRDGRTLIPLKLYWNEKGLAKLEIGLAKGKKNHDKRETDKAADEGRDWQRDKARLMKGDRGRLVWTSAGVRPRAARAVRRLRNTASAWPWASLGAEPSGPWAVRPDTRTRVVSTGISTTLVKRGLVNSPGGLTRTTAS